MFRSYSSPARGCPLFGICAGTATTLSGFTTETLTSIENVIGSNGNDTITGTAYRNDLDGGGGDDMLIGGGGIDDYYGGAGFDTLDLSGSNSKWRVDLDNGTAELKTATSNVHSVDFKDIECHRPAQQPRPFGDKQKRSSAWWQFFRHLLHPRRR